MSLQPFASPARSGNVTTVSRETEVIEVGDREEFTRWARARQGHLLRVALLLTGDRQRAEDLVQEALTKIALRWTRLRDSSPDAYARKVMYHDNVSSWRRRRLEVVTDRPPERPGQGPPTERRLLLAAALATLTARQRAVIVLRYFEDLSERDTAAVLGIAVGTVKSQTNLSLRRLREAAPELADYLYEES
jgi:RNA polymerase sigma-70 factor (sigma-E family)